MNNLEGFGMMTTQKMQFEDDTVDFFLKTFHGLNDHPWE